MQARRALLADRVDDREDHEPARRRDGQEATRRGARGDGGWRSVVTTSGTASDPASTVRSVATTRGLEVLQRDAGQDRRRAPDDHHEHRDDDGRARA